MPHIARNDGLRSGLLSGYYLAGVLEVSDAERQSAKHVVFVERRHGERRKETPESGSRQRVTRLTT
jgi:hypothetical protein